MPQHKASELRELAEILELCGTGVWEYDPAADRLVWRSRLAAPPGCPEDLPPDSLDAWLGRVHPEDRPRFQAWMGAAPPAGGPLGGAQFRMRRGDGQWRWVEARGQAMGGGGQGRPLRVAGTLADIGPWKAAQQSLAESEERLRLVTDNVAEVFWMADAALQKMFYVSPAYERIWQRPAAGLYADPRSFLAAVHPDDLGPLLAKLADKSLGLPFEHEYRIVRPDGSVRWIWDRGFPVAEAGGPARRYVGLAQDITERKRSEEDVLRLNAELEARVAERAAELEAKTKALRESEERFRLAAEAAHEGLWDWNFKTGAVYISPALAALLDCGPPEAERDAAWMWRSLPHPDERAAVAAAIDRCLRDAGDFELEFRVRSKSGGYRWILSRGKVVERDAGGEPLRVVGTLADIDERKRAEALNRRLAAIIEASSDLIATSTPEGRLEYMNQAGRALLGMGGTEPVEHTRIADYHTASTYRRVAEEGIPAALGRGRWLGDNALSRRDGSEVPVSQLILTHRNQETGQVEFLSTICRDISERRQAEEALRRLQQEQALILDSAPAMIWYKDTQNRMLRVNQAVADSLGLPKALIEGRHTADFYPEEADRYFQDDLIVAQSGRPRLGIVEPYRLPSGEKRWIQTDKVPLKDESGRTARILVMSVDITERKRIEEALREADRQKDEFLAVLAHELRNPLAPLRNGLQILRLARDDPQMTDRALEMMGRQLRDMARLIDDLLDLGRINRGKIELRKAAVDLADVARHAVETSRPLIDQRGHELLLDLPSEPVLLGADSTRLAQVFANLLNNAAKYTPPGGRIVFAVERRGREAVARVADNGVGIPAAMLGKVFDMFFRLDHAPENAQGGLGIGLNLVRRLAELHGGSVEARSRGLGKGSEFTVRLPLLGLAEAEEAPARPPAPAAGLRVLVADDNADVAASNAWLLEVMGHEVRTARDGLEAVQAAADYRPDLVLLDIGMPGVDGYEACRRIRAQPWGREMAVVALTGWGQDQDKARSQAAGFDLHLVKPLDPQELERLLAALPGKGAGPA